MAVGVQAQTRVVKVHSNGQEVYSSEATGTNTITFSGSSATFTHNGNAWATAISAIDSMTFEYSEDDTTSVDYGNAVVITWNGSNVTVTNPYSSDGIAVSASSGHVTVTSTTDSADITYVLRGTSTDGSFTITSNTKIILSLDTLQLTNPNGAAILMSSDYRTSIYMHGTSVLADGTGGSNKGALQSAGKFEIEGPDVLQVSGYLKHGIQSSGKTEMNGGTLQVLTAVKDGMNVDNFVMNGGTVNVTSSGDGIDGDQGYIQINDGSLTINCASDDVKGLSCDSIMNIAGGTISVTVSGDQSKALKSGMDITISGGTLTVNANGTLVLEADGSGYDPSYCSGIKADGNITVTGGTTTVSCPTTNAGGRAVATDGNFTISGGTMNLTATGTCASYTNSDAETDKYSSTCIKADGNVNVNGGTLNLTAGGRGIKCDGVYTQTAGTVIASTSANGFTTVGSGTSCTDGFAPSCLNSDSNVVFTGGSFNGTSTGTGGRGISADGKFVFGTNGGVDSLLSLYLTTSGSPVNGVSTGMGGGSSTTDIWKGLPKGLKIDDSIHIYSGHVRSYCAQTSGDPNGEALESKTMIVINGGYVECNSYDDAINAASGLTINGGHVWAYSRGNDAIDNNGSYTYFNGGVIIAQSDAENGVDASLDAGGHFYVTGATVVAQGTQGAWDTPTTTSSTQKYLSLGSSSGGGPGGGTSTSSVSLTGGFCIRSGSTDVMVYKANAISGSGFETGTKPPGGGGGGTMGGSSIAVTSPSITSGTYTLYTGVTVSGGSSWHGLYTGGTCTTSGSGTSVTAQ